MNFYKYTLLYFFLFSASTAQTTYFEKIFGDTTDNCAAVSLVQLQSGNIVVATNCLSIVNSTNSIKLYKFDAFGNQLMAVTYPVTNNEAVNKMKMSPEGNLLFAGVATDSTGVSDGMLMKTDTSGNIIWRSTYGRPLTNESLQGIGFTSQGDILTSGYTKNMTGSGHSFYLVKTDTAGNLFWNKDYNSANNSYSDAVIGLAHGDIIISGDRQLPNNNYTNTIIHTDSLGDMTWDFELPNTYNNGCKNDFLSSSGDIIIVGESATATSFSFDPAITRIDTAGNIKWSYIYNGSSLSTDAALDMTEPATENYLVTGYALNPGNNSADVVLMRIDSAGNELTRVYFGDSTGVDIAYSIISNPFNNTCYLAGTTVKNLINRSYLIGTSLLGIQAGVEIDETAGNEFKFYPNPCNDLLYFPKPVNTNYNVMIYDFTGKQISLPFEASKNFISTATLSNGIYFAAINLKNQVLHRSFVVLH